MNASQILALPTQTHSRLIKASDNGHYYAISSGESGADARMLITDAFSIVSVADAAARKTEGTYTGANAVSVGCTRVIQLNLPGILWNLVAADVTQDSSWIGVPYTVDPDGDVIVNMQLADVTGTVPDRNVLGVSGNCLRLGDGATPDGKDVFALPPDLAVGTFSLGMTGTEYLKSARFVYTKTTAPAGTVNVGGGATHVKFLRWDGTFHSTLKVISGDTAFTAADWGTAPASPYNTRLPKYGAICPCNSGGTATGYLTYLSLWNNQITSFSEENLSSLITLNLSSNQITSFSGANLSSLTSLTLHGNLITSFSGKGLSSVTYLSLASSGDPLTSFDGNGLSSLTQLTLNNVPITSFSGDGLSSVTQLTLSSTQLAHFDGSGLSSLTQLAITISPLASLSGSGLPLSLTRLTANNNQLASVLLNNHNLSYFTDATTGSTVSNNNLSFEALIAFLESLAVTTTGVIRYGGNPGSAAFETWLLTGNARGYVWVNA